MLVGGNLELGVAVDTMGWLEVVVVHILFHHFPIHLFPARPVPGGLMGVEKVVGAVPGMHPKTFGCPRTCRILPSGRALSMWGMVRVF